MTGGCRPPTDALPHVLTRPRTPQGDAFGAKNVIQSRLYGAFYCTAKTNLECLRLTPAALSVLGRVVGRCVCALPPFTARTTYSRGSPLAPAPPSCTACSA